MLWLQRWLAEYLRSQDLCLACCLTLRCHIVQVSFTWCPLNKISNLVCLAVSMQISWDACKEVMECNHDWFPTSDVLTPFVLQLGCTLIHLCWFRWRMWRLHQKQLWKSPQRSSPLRWKTCSSLWPQRQKSSKQCKERQMLWRQMLSKMWASSHLVICASACGTLLIDTHLRRNHLPCENDIQLFICCLHYLLAERSDSENAVRSLSRQYWKQQIARCTRDTSVSVTANCKLFSKVCRIKDLCPLLVIQLREARSIITDQQLLACLSCSRVCKIQACPTHLICSHCHYSLDSLMLGMMCL